MQALKKLDSNPDKWFKAESEQMKQIHRVYRDSIRETGAVISVADVAAAASSPVALDALSQPALAANTTGGSGSVGAGESASASASSNPDYVLPPANKKDPESYLPKDSILRSKDGEMLRPLHAPFKDFETFVKTLSPEYWRDIFAQGHDGHDRYIAEAAQTIVTHICSAQAVKELRVRHGSAPFGKFWRTKREQITPLALTMHELKLWAAHTLRTMNPMVETTHTEISKRIRYIQGLQRKEVWGPAASSLARGMRPVAHDKLFRLLLTTREDLAEARDYAFRQWCRRKSREKFLRLGNLLKDVLFTEAKCLSMLFSLETDLGEDSAPRLLPTDFMKTAHNQTFIDYTNMANVCLRALFDLEFVRQSIKSDYSKPAASAEEAAANQESILDELTNWPRRNLFISPTGLPIVTSEIQGEGLPTLPLVYAETGEKVCAEFTKLGDKRIKQPPSVRTQAGALKKVFNGDVETAQKVVRCTLKLLASLQDLVVSIYYVHEFWETAGEGGDFTVYDTLRSSVITVMEDCASRVLRVQQAEKELVQVFTKSAADLRERMEMKRLKTKKAEYEPVWVQNVTLTANDVCPLTKKACTEAFRQAHEIARDAYDYSLTSAQFDDRVQRLRDAVAALRRDESAAPLEARFGLEFARSGPGGQGSAAAASAATDRSEVARYHEEREALEKEAKEIRGVYEKEVAERQSRASFVSITLDESQGLGGQDMTEEEVERYAKLPESSNPFAEDDKNPFAG